MINNLSNLNWDIVFLLEVELEKILYIKRWVKKYYFQNLKKLNTQQVTVQIPILLKKILQKIAYKFHNFSSFIRLGASLSNV